jgi:hypothetical protein
VVLRKPNKPDYSNVKAYRVISLLNCIGKVAEKVVANKLADIVERRDLLHDGQFGSRRGRSAIDAVAVLINRTQEAWKRKEIVAVLLMDVKGAFDHVSRGRLLARMVAMRIESNLVRWVDSFLQNRRIRMVIDGCELEEREVRTGIPQGSPVSPILFAIYLSGVFSAVESSVPYTQALSFADDVAWMVRGKDVGDVTAKLEQCAARSIYWAQANAVAFDSAKTEALLLTRSRKKFPRMQIQVDGHRISYNKEATRWLGVWLDSQLTLKQHHQHRLSKARKAEARVRSLTGKLGLTPANARRIQIAAVQAVALYGTELWWDGQQERKEDIQKLVNRQARAITGALPSTALGPLVKESGLRSAESLLNNRTRRFGLRLLNTPNRGPDGETIINPASEMVRQSPLVLTKPRFPVDDPRWKLPGYNRSKEPKLWKEPKTLADRLWDAATDPVRSDIPPQDEDDELSGRARLRSPILVEATQMLWTRSSLKARVIIEDTERAKATAESWATPDKGIAMFTDGSKLEDGWTGCAAVWKLLGSGEWQGRKIFMGRNKEVFDAECNGVRTETQGTRGYIDGGDTGFKS